MDKLDKIIQEKLKDRTFEPSASAWERLNHQLNIQEQQKPNKKWLYYIGYAASVALLVSLFFMMNKKNDDDSIINKEIMVETKIDTTHFKQPLIKKQSINKTVVLAKTSEKESKKPSPITKNTKKQLFYTHQAIRERKNILAKNESVQKEYPKQSINIRKNDQAISISNIENSMDQNKKLKKLNTPLRTGKITINPDDLLFEVTHSSTEIKEYYAKYKVDRSKVLLNIKRQLRKSNLKINPETILAEVEKDVNDDFFKNHFLENLKSKVSTIVVAIADRNKE